MRRCDDIYEIVTVYYPTGCVNTTSTPTSTTTTTTSTSSSTTTTTTTINYNSYNYQGQYHDCDTCANIGGFSISNIQLLTIGKWYIWTSPVTNISRKVQIVTYQGPSLTTPNAVILDSTKQDTCGALPPCPE